MTDDDLRRKLDERKYSQLLNEQMNLLNRFHNLQEKANQQSKELLDDRVMLRRMSAGVTRIEDLIRTRGDDDDQRPVGSNQESSVNSSRATLDPEQGTGAEQESAVLAPVMQKMSDMQEQVDKMGAHVDKMDARMRRLRLWARLVPLYLIVVVLVSYPYVAAITGMSASDMTQYISPVTGLAGAVIGYWFGQTGPGSGPGD